MTLKRQLWFWAITVTLAILFVWLFNDILLPFVLGAAIAYLLEPVTRLITKQGFPRWLASLTILSIFFIVIIALSVLIIPIAYRELLDLANAFPEYLEQIWVLIHPYTIWLQDKLGADGNFEFKDALKQSAGNAIKVGSNVLAGIVNGGQTLISVITLFVFTPIVSFFMIKEWPHMTSWIDNQLPRQSRDTILDILKKIDGKISGFVRGQITIAFALGMIYALALFLAGLNFGFLIGLFAGFLSIIPLVGSSVGLFVSVFIAWLQSGELSYVATIATIFIIGQFLEGNFITPKLLGKSVGLHSLWILFALMAGGSLFGIVGMLLAVPIAASAGVLTGFALEEYRKSTYYDYGSKTKNETKVSI